MPSARIIGPEQINAILSERLPEHLVDEHSFERWYEVEFKRKIDIPAMTVFRQVERALQDERARVCDEERCNRPVWKMFTGGGKNTKSATSTRSKIGRRLLELKATGKEGPRGRLSEEQVRIMVQDFPDLGRFRVICDYTMDVDRALRVLVDRRRKRLRVGEEDYRLKGSFKDYVHDLSRRDPARGHRAKQFSVVVPSGGDNYCIEVQFMTQNQHIWDQRNHPVYEWTREGITFPDRLLLQDVGLAEALYILDEQATRNWKAFLKEKRRARKT